MLLRPLCGVGQLAFDDGETFEVSIDIKFRTLNGRIIGEGRAFHPQGVAFSLKRGAATLTASRRRVRVFIVSGDIHGVLQLKTTGPVQPLE